ncbi:MAG: SGNH/GDSL hydrolase family protein [Gloeobacterales cyanobacterium]
MHMEQAFSPTSADNSTYPITSLFVFGDSLSDTGNLSTLTYLGSGGQFWFPPSPPLGISPLPTFPPPFGGPYYSKDPYYNSVAAPFTLDNPPKVRASNGDIWADILPKDLGLPTYNFAFAGATTGSNNGLQPFLPSSSPALPGLQNEISDFTNLVSGKADPNALYVVWAGANDGFNLAGSLASSPPSDLQVTLSMIVNAAKTAVDNIETAITTLAYEGADTFMVPNLADLGKTPLLGQSTNSAFVGTAFSLAFNIDLAAELPHLEHSLNIDIVQPDVYTLTQEAFNRPQEFGFTNVSDPLIAQNPNDPLVNPNKFFWYDYQHPTTQAQEVLADFFQDNLFTAGLIKNGSSFEGLPQPIGGSFPNETNLATVLTQGYDFISSQLNQDLSGLLPNLISFANETNLDGALLQGISDLKCSDLGKDLFKLIPDVLSGAPNFAGQNLLDNFKGFL